MKFFFSVLIAVSLCAELSQAQVSTIQDYNNQLPYWGVSWAPGAHSMNGYYPSFYTGFAMRSQFPERIHVRLARGNQTRVSVILDDQTLQDYLYDLVARSEFYSRVTAGPLNIQPAKAQLTPQVSYFQQIVSSNQYRISDVARQSLSAEQLYSKSLSILKELNAGRIFDLNIDLKREFNKWKTDVQSEGSAQSIVSNANKTVQFINHLVFGRINFTEKPSAEVMSLFTSAVQSALDNESDSAFIPKALALFKAVTGTKYAFRVLNAQGQFVSPIQCSVQSCRLVYPEFTAIYPTGTAMASTSDEFGNRINLFATPGLWNFLAYGGSREVDNIRDEPYYGYIPKMDYEGIGNGYHNPAVRFYAPPASLKQALGVPSAHNTLWSVKRGGVSHGCARLPTGHMWELRHIFPVENSKMTKVHFFGNNSQDFDVYDVDGDGQVEVMGVEYMISYGLQGTEGLAKREGTDMKVSGVRKRDFYTDLYGARNVFEVDASERYFFINPKTSLPSYLDYKRKSVSTRVTIQGKIPLYEQTFEREKVQFYALPGMSEKVIRLMGRVRGCAPTSDKQSCGQMAFENEMAGLL